MSLWEKRLTALLIFGAIVVPSPPARAADTKASETKATVVLETLLVKGRAPKTGYTRAQFGPSWSDVDRNGCDTRNDILTRDLTQIIYREGTQNCIVLSGVLIDPFSGEAIAFTRGVATSSEVQIDHSVALSDAWQKGAQKLSADTRKAFANDPLNLMAVKRRLNSQKGDGDAATWLPPLKSYRCAYVSRQIAVKAKYSIWVTAAEKAAMKSILAKCPNQMIR
jgi:hypothetical protein